MAEEIKKSEKESTKKPATKKTTAEKKTPAKAEKKVETAKAEVKKETKKAVKATVSEEVVAKATVKYARISSRKVAIVANLIRGKNVSEAYAILRNQPQKAARVIEKVLKSATSNAVNNLKLKEENLIVKTCYVDEGIVMKRAKMDSRGHVGRKDHKTSHITIIVSELNK